MSYIIVKKSKVHGTGVFAKWDIPAGSKIIEYVGRKISKSESENISDERYSKYKGNEGEVAGVYLFELNSKYDIDGNVSWNDAKYINHSCDPNAETLNDRNHIWIIAIKDIKKGEEITYDYGYNLDNYKDHPCFCGSKKCCKFIVGESYSKRLC